MSSFCFVRQGLQAAEVAEGGFITYLLTLPIPLSPPAPPTTTIGQPPQMNLLDRAIKLAAEQDEPLEMNFVRKHALEQAEELGVSVRDAATRVFSNSSGGCKVLAVAGAAAAALGSGILGCVHGWVCCIGCVPVSVCEAGVPCSLACITGICSSVASLPLSPLSTDHPRPCRLLLLQRQPGCGELLLV
jgi:hypothetical protein